MCVCVRERERERERDVYRERDTKRGVNSTLPIPNTNTREGDIGSACVHVGERERGTERWM